MAALLLAVMGLGCIALWLGVPVLTLLVLSQVVGHSDDLIFYALVLVPTAMVVFTLLLARVNRLYMRVTRTFERDGGPFEIMFIASLVAAFIALVVWFLIFADSPPWVTV